ncbi:alpha/beta hydrolase family protein [Sphingomonas koreensis]
MLLAALTLAAQATATPCQIGAYSGTNGRYVVITELPDSATTGGYRYTLDDGRFGVTGDAVVRCAADAVTVADAHWPRMALKETQIRFKSGDVTLAGILIEPPRASRAPLPPLVVTVHGSEDSGWIHRQRLPYVLAAQGIAVFAFDKRGTGKSEGVYHQNFGKLAEDVVAASATARKLAAGRYARFGLIGGSQGGWVAPRAANAAGAEFVAVGYGLLMDPLEEDAEQVATELRDAGFGADALAKGKEITDATGAVMAAHFRDGYAGLAAVKAKYGAEPWFATIKGEFTGDVLRTPEAELRATGAAKHDNLDIDWRYDALGEMRKVKAPQLWVIAGADREAPPERTVTRLQAMRQEGKRIAIVRYPATDHGIFEFEQAPDGSRRMTRIADGYFRLIGDWIKGEWRPPYGRGEVIAK